MEQLRSLCNKHIYRNRAVVTYRNVRQQANSGSRGVQTLVASTGLVLMSCSPANALYRTGISLCAAAVKHVVDVEHWNDSYLAAMICDSSFGVAGCGHVLESLL